MGQTSSFPVVQGLAARIAANGTTSDTVDLRGATLCGIMVPSAMSNTTITFQAGVVAAALGAVKGTDNAPISVTCGTAEAAFYPLDPSDFAGARYVAVVSGGTEAAERVFTLATRPL